MSRLSNPQLWSTEEVVSDDGERRPGRFDPNFALVLLVVLVLGTLIVVVLGPALVRRIGPQTREADSNLASRLGDVEQRIDQQAAVQHAADQQRQESHLLEDRLRLKAQEDKLQELRQQLAEQRQEERVRQHQAEIQALRQQLTDAQARRVMEKNELDRKVAELAAQKSDLEARMSYLQQTVTGLEEQVKDKNRLPKTNSPSSSRQNGSSGPSFIVITGRSSK